MTRLRVATVATLLLLLTGCASTDGEADRVVNGAPRAAAVPLEKATSASVITTWCNIQTRASAETRTTAAVALAGEAAVQVLSESTGAAQLLVSDSCKSAKVEKFMADLDDDQLVHTDVPMVMAQIRAPLHSEKPVSEDSLRRLQQVADQYPGARVRRETTWLVFELASSWPVYDSDGVLLDDARLQSLLREVGSLLGTAVGTGTGTVEVTTL